jgi:hypothetical protein
LNRTDLALMLAVVLSFAAACTPAPLTFEQTTAGGVDDGTCVDSGCHSQIERISDKHDCVSCHGGDSSVATKEGSHPSFTPTLNTSFAAEFPLKNKGWNPTSKYDESIAVNGEAELRFVNPGDLRVADVSCGASNPSDGSVGCHGGIVERMKLNIHSTMHGDLSQVLFLNGDPIQPDNTSLFGGHSIEDPDFNPTQAPTGAVGHIDALPPIECLLIADARLDTNGGGIITKLCPTAQPNCCPEGFSFVGSADPDLMNAGEVVSRMYANNDCPRCHLWNEGSKRTGDIRSSGCTACHMKYANDGLSRSADESIDRAVLSRPEKHLFKGAMDDDQCAHCHNRGGRIPQGYYGRRERAGGGPTSPFNPPNASYADTSLLGEGPYSSMHGRVFPFYIDDEDTTNDYDETPPDVHTTYGMQCVDCHVESEMHGDGNIYADRFYEVEIKCETCHGSADTIADGVMLKGNSHPRVSVSDGKIYLDLLSREERLEITQIKDVLDSGENPRAQEGCGRASHAGKLECYTCHSTWYPNCFHCHVERDDGDPQRSWTDGLVRLGNLTRDDRKFISIDTFVLGVNRNDAYEPEGRYAPFIGFGTFNTYKDGLTQVYKDRIPEATNGSSYGIPWNKIHPHTNQTTPRNCDECHRPAGVPNDIAMLEDVECDDQVDATYVANCRQLDRVRVTYGYGSTRYRLAAFLADPNGGDDLAVEYVLDRFVGADRYTINCPDPMNTTDPACLGPNPVSHTGFRALSIDEVAKLFAIEVTPHPRPDAAFPDKPPLGTLK